MKKFLSHTLFILSIVLLNIIIHDLIGNRTYDFLLLKLQLVKNEAFLLGLFQETSHLLRIVFTTVAIGFFTLIACYFYAFLPKGLNLIRLGMTLLLAGAIGNSFEKIIHGHVYDFINIKIFYFKDFFFNINDLTQIIGFAIITFSLFKDKDLIWLTVNGIRRRRVILFGYIEKPFFLKLLGLVTLLSITQIILTTTLLFPFLGETQAGMKYVYLFCILFINILLLPVIGLFFLKELNRTLGPVYAIKLYLEKDDKNERLQLRKDDYFKDIEKAFNDFLD